MESDFVLIPPACLTQYCRIKKRKKTIFSVLCFQPSKDILYIYMDILNWKTVEILHMGQKEGSICFANVVRFLSQNKPLYTCI